MGNVRRLVASISAQFNDLVDQVENHEAVAASALKRFRTQVQEANVQFRMMEKELAEAKKNRAKAVHEAESWKSRATNHAETDREKALQCVQRYKASTKEVEFWTEKENELSKHIHELQRELVQIESKHSAMRLEFQKYVSRDRTATLKGINPGDDSDSLKDIFDRWDKRLIRKEVRAEVGSVSLDDFANEMKAQEEALDLEETLAELIKKQ